jgi:organic hydroperoxide reductase OsmC/OhrA
VTGRDDGRFGFVAIELTASIRTDPRLLEAAESAAHQADRACLISMALDIPVHVDAVVRPVQRALEVVV